jgi:phosphoribosyl 1,2-cyclic phosphodiesterase
MRIRVWGTRGSLAAPGPRTVRYGGNTSCVGVTLRDGTPLALDAGSGIRELGVDIGAAPGLPVHVLLTHLHMDHLQGLAFFAPLWTAGREVHVWGPASATRTLAERVATYMSPPLFPVRIDEIPSELVFHDCPAEPFTIGTATVTAEFVSHQGPTVGYRIDEDGRSFAYLPDHEPAIGVDLSTLSSDWLSGFSLLHGVDVLFHDAQYFDDEYPSHVGWGHSAVSHTVALARRAEARQLVLFHHDPAHSDADLERLLAIACELWEEGPNAPVLAYEGMEIVLDDARSGAAEQRTAF